MESSDQSAQVNDASVYDSSVNHIHLDETLATITDVGREELFNLMTMFTMASDRTDITEDTDENMHKLLSLVEMTGNFEEYLNFLELWYAVYHRSL